MPALGADDVVAAAVGGTGTVNAKLRLATSQLDNILDAVRTTMTTGFLQSAAVATGSGTALSMSGEINAFQIHITGITTGTVTFQGSLDGIHWFNVAMRDTTSTTSTTLATS